MDNLKSNTTKNDVVQYWFYFRGRFLKNCATTIAPSAQLLTALSGEEVERRKHFLELNLIPGKKQSKSLASDTIVEHNFQKIDSWSII